MANEHVLMTQKTIPVSKTCSNTTGIEKGTVAAISDPNTVAAASTDASLVAGVIYTEKIANDGNTQVSVLTGPGDELRAYASGSVVVGDRLCTAIAATGSGNWLRAANSAALSGAAIIGVAQETASAGETFKYVLQIGA